MIAHGWPGNLRELRNAVERAVILAHRDVLDPDDLGLVAESVIEAEVSGHAVRLGALVSLDAVEREHIARVVAQSPSLESAARTLEHRCDDAAAQTQALRARVTVMIPAGLRLRFVVAAGLLVLTTVTASVWTLFALSRHSGIVTDTVRQSESVTAVTSRLAGALEREDDAVLLVLAGDPRALDGPRERARRCRQGPRRTLRVSWNRMMSASSRRHCTPSFWPTERRRMASSRCPSNGKRSRSITRTRTRSFAASSSSPPRFAIDISHWRAKRSPALAMRHRRLVARCS